MKNKSKSKGKNPVKGSLSSFIRLTNQASLKRKDLKEKNRRHSHKVALSFRQKSQRNR